MVKINIGKFMVAKIFNSKILPLYTSLIHTSWVLLCPLGRPFFKKVFSARKVHAKDEFQCSHFSISFEHENALYFTTDNSYISIKQLCRNEEILYLVT